MCGAFHVPPKTMLQSCHLHISTKMVLFQNCTPCPHPPNTHILLIPPIALAQGIHTRSNDLMRQYSTEYSNELVHMIRWDWWIGILNKIAKYFTIQGVSCIIRPHIHCGNSLSVTCTTNLSYTPHPHQITSVSSPPEVHQHVPHKKQQPMMSWTQTYP